MKKVVEIAHDILLNHMDHPCICADFTMGQGHDTLFMAKQENVQHVYAFDIQEEAWVNTTKRLEKEQLQEKVTCILDGHEHMDQYIKEKIDIGIFNFGFLPQGNSQITTKKENSQIAVEKALWLLHKHGILLLVIYPGHEEGKEESIFFDTWCAALSSHMYSVCKITMHNKKDAPYIMLIEKMKESCKGALIGNPMQK